MSFAKLMQRFKSGVLAGDQPPQQQDPLRLATAAVLLDIGYADDTMAQELVKAAGEIRAQTIDHFALTHFIRRNSPLNDRIEIVKTMWRIAYADGRLTDYENYLVRKLADLLGLEHHVMIDAKVSVLRELGLATT